MTLPGPEPTDTTRLTLVNQELGIIASLSAMTVVLGDLGKACNTICLLLSIHCNKDFTTLTWYISCCIMPGDCGPLSLQILFALQGLALPWCKLACMKHLQGQGDDVISANPLALVIHDVCAMFV